MTSASPVKPAVLRWAIAEDGRPLTEIAERTDVDLFELQAWLSGHGSPSHGQLSRLSDVLGRSRATLLLPAAPVEASTPTAFRRAVGSGNDVSRRARRVVRDSRQIQKALSWIRRDEEPVSPPLATFTSKPDEAAAEAREWTGLSVETQLEWDDDYQALREWRACLDANGIYVFALQIGRGEIRGFSDWDDYAPMIGVNTSSTTPAARVFSIAHEFGHLVCRNDATCEDFDVTGVAQSKIETWCEAFAAAFLMPAGDVRQVIRQQAESARANKPPSDIDQVRLLMRKFNVSARAAAIRLENLGVAPKGLYTKVNQIFVPKAPTSGGKAYSAPRAVMRVRQYGVEVIESLMSSLPPRDALRVLRIDALDARKLAEEVPQIHGF